MYFENSEAEIPIAQMRKHNYFCTNFEQEQTDQTYVQNPPINKHSKTPLLGPPLVLLKFGLISRVV